MLFFLAAKDSSDNYTWVFWLIVLAIAGITKFVNYCKQQTAEAAVRAERAERYKNRRNVAPPPLARAITPPQAHIPRPPIEEQGPPAWQQAQESVYTPEEVPAFTMEATELNDAEQAALAALQQGGATVERTEARKVSSREQSALLKVLRDPASLRTAIIYREILGEPMALRKARTM